MKLLAKVNSTFDGIIGFGAFLACAILIFVMLSVNAEVIMRYFLNRPLIWVMEISEICLLFITFLAAAWVLKVEGHVKMDIVVNRLGPRTQIVINTITSILSIIGVSLVVWYGVGVTWDQFQRGLYAGGSVLQIPNAAILFIIPVGSFLLFLQLLRRTNGYLRGWRRLADSEQEVV